MLGWSRRAFLEAAASTAVLGLAGCATTVSPSAYVDPVWRAADVSYPAREATGTVVVDADQHYLYLVQGAGKARRYGVGVGNEGARWAGIATVHNKQEWPDWYPTAEILQRHPELTPDLKRLPGGLGLAKWRRQPPWSSCALSLAAKPRYAVSHSRHQRAVDNRQKRVFRLHPHV
jgi:hypothetical protein